MAMSSEALKLVSAFRKAITASGADAETVHAALIHLTAESYLTACQSDAHRDELESDPNAAPETSDDMGYENAMQALAEYDVDFNEVISAKIQGMMGFGDD